MTPQPLPLEPVEPLPLREAYRRAGYSNKRTFEQAMREPALAITLKIYADIIAKETK